MGLNLEQIKSMVVDVDCEEELNDWEEKFIADMYKKVIEDENYPTPKQLTKIEELHEKYNQ